MKKVIKKIKKREFRVGDYRIRIKGRYLYIKVKRYAQYYQLKLEEEGLVLDKVIRGELDSLFHCVNDEVLVCDFCGKSDCNFDCDESVAEWKE